MPLPPRRISAEQLTLPEKDLMGLLVADVASGMKADQVQLLVSGALAIKAGGSPLAKTGAVFYATTRNSAGAVVLVTKAANTDMAALSGTVTNTRFNVYCFFIDSAGTLTSAMGTEGATLAAVVFPPFPDDRACIGFVVINPTGTGGFVGGTTPLDDATVVPNAVYVNTVGSFKPTVAQSVIP